MSDMTEIDVPDWVVEVAMAAGEKFDGENTVSMYATVRDLRREEMRTSITAALGAWVVPACYRLHQPNHSSEWISGMYGGPPMNHKAWSVEQTFTLLKEKPE